MLVHLGFNGTNKNIYEMKDILIKISLCRLLNQYVINRLIFVYLVVLKPKNQDRTKEKKNEIL